MNIDYTYEIEGIKIFLEKEQKHFRDICKNKGEAIKALKEIEEAEITTEAGMRGLMTAIEEIQKLQNALQNTANPAETNY